MLLVGCVSEVIVVISLSVIVKFVTTVASVVRVVIIDLWAHVTVVVVCIDTDCGKLLAGYGVEMSSTSWFVYSVYWCTFNVQLKVSSSFTVKNLRFLLLSIRNQKWVLYKVTIRPGFSGTVAIFNNVSRKTNRSSPKTPICPVSGLVSRICPDLPISAAVCLCIGGQKLAQILSVCMKQSLEAGALPRTLMRELTMLTQTPKSDPRRLAPVALAPYDWRLWRLSQIAVPKLWPP